MCQSLEPGSGAPQREVGERGPLTYDEASQQSHAQCDGQRKRLDASLLGRVHASVCNVREDVFQPERQTRTHLQDVTPVQTAVGVGHEIITPFRKRLWLPWQRSQRPRWRP